MNFLSISELFDLLAGRSDDPFLNQSFDEVEAKLDSIRCMIQMHDATGTPSLISIIDVLRYELEEVPSHA
jgi:hypothetical protein